MAEAQEPVTDEVDQQRLERGVIQGARDPPSMCLRSASLLSKARGDSTHMAFDEKDEFTHGR